MANVKHEKVSKKRTREILKTARFLMNDNGKHWIKGRLSRKKSVGMCYCSIGAIRAASDNPSEVETAVKALATIGLGMDDPGVRYGDERGFFPYRYKIENWNDRPSTTWKDVDATFRKAVRSLR